MNKIKIYALQYIALFLIVFFIMTQMQTFATLSIAVRDELTIFQGQIPEIDPDDTDQVYQLYESLENRDNLSLAHNRYLQFMAFIFVSISIILSFFFAWQLFLVKKLSLTKAFHLFLIQFSMHILILIFGMLYFFISASTLGALNLVDQQGILVTVLLVYAFLYLFFTSAQFILSLFFIGCKPNFKLRFYILGGISALLISASFVFYIANILIQGVLLLLIVLLVQGLLAYEKTTYA